MDQWNFIIPSSSQNNRHKRKEIIDLDSQDFIDHYLWVDQYEPKREEDICVKKDKVREIKDAIERSAVGNQSNPIKMLILSGPSGCGKSTLIRLLSKTMQLELVEWKNPTNEYDHQSNYVNTISLFNQFLFFSIMRGDSSKPKLIFVDDIPDLTTLEVKNQFHTSLRSCLNMPAAFLLVFVVSNAYMESTYQRGSYDGKLNNMIDIMPRDLEDDQRVRHIKCNPVIKANMTKILNHIVSCEGVRIKTSELSDLVEKSNGDIRSAINNLQFYDKKPGKAPKQQPKKAKSLENPNVKAFDEQIGPLDLFHALGKVLYAKRNPDGSYESKPDHIINKLPMENDLFITYLHQNCLGFFQDIESCAESMGYISEADTIRSKHDWQEAVASEYRNLISIHGIMRKPDVRTNYRFYSIQKPLFFDAQSTMQLQKRQNYQQALMQSVEARSIQYQSQEIQDNPMEDIEDFSDDNFEDEFDDIYGDGSDLAFLANNF